MICYGLTCCVDSPCSSWADWGMRVHVTWLALIMLFVNYFLTLFILVNYLHILIGIEVFFLNHVNVDVCYVCLSLYLSTHGRVRVPENINVCSHELLAV